MDDELLDLVDKNDVVIGALNRSEHSRLLSENLGYFRASDLFILNSIGKIFVPIRTADKSIAPNGFDFSAAGHVAAGEDYAETIIREAKEELYIDIDKDSLQLVAKNSFESIKYIDSLFVYRTDKTPNINPKDYVSAEWLLPDELLAKIDAGHPAKTTLREAIIMLQHYLESQ